MEPYMHLSRKERERLNRREEILAAARKVFSERGFQKATLDEIAVIAEFGKGTIYNYFKNKEELFACIIERGTARFQKHVKEATDSQPNSKEKLGAYIDAAFQFFEKHRQIYSIFLLEKHKLASSLSEATFNKFCDQQYEVFDFLRALFDEGVRAGEFRNLDSLRFAQALISFIHASVFQAIREPKTTNLHEHANFIRSLIFEGITDHAVS